MVLPSFDPNVFWKNFEIDTPTFELSPVEKPDMSPFLIHMTGKNQIKKILLGVGSSEQQVNHGFLKAGIPEYNRDVYMAPIVCFSESPTFALDFFRYRSFPRWQNDLLYGIGFKKNELVSLGVRPVIYLEQKTIALFNHLYKEYIEKSNHFVDDNVLNEKITNLIMYSYPLLFPLLENTREQGFIWEREWRYPDPSGIQFPYDFISVICVPDDEKQEIVDLLGEYSRKMKFVSTWREYSEVTNYLGRKKIEWVNRSKEIDDLDDENEKLKILSTVSQKYETTINSLSAYEAFFLNLEKSMDYLQEEKDRLQKEMDDVNQKIKTVKSKIDENGQLNAEN